MQLFHCDEEAFFLKRPNRFIIIAELNGEEVRCHCPNPGRMGELLTPRARLILEKSRDKGRKTPYSAVAVYKKDLIVPLTAARANRVAEELILPRLYPEGVIKREVSYKNSRIDFLITEGEQRTYAEVKSCTLFFEDRACFPDAPTLRGVKHLKELMEIARGGDKARVVFTVFHPEAVSFSPNRETDPLFADTLKEASMHIDVTPVRVSVNERGEASLPDDPWIQTVHYV